ncbi:MAG: hypothetical protein OEV89_08040 [Desulfobulbaceae bacterium]|nr:hypothetical protein [Desulfobulbaceae bacterium]
MRYAENKISKSFNRPKMTVAVAGMLLGAVCLLPGAGMAQVTGPCVSCHTMHNSQGGASMNPASTTTVFRSLTKGDCVGCHTSTTNALVETNTPKVNHGAAPASPTDTLAGGSFYWVQTANAKGHNVLGIAGADSLGNTPPGGSALASQLTCAGTVGCHGDRTVADQYASISGSHHAAPQNAGTVAGAVDGTSLANSYRFLKGIKGIEDPTWETPATLAANKHNQYYGVSRTSDAVTGTDGTISALCGQCHGAFHASATAHNDTTAPAAGISYANNMTSPWVRHPTDFDMNKVKTKEYGAYGGSGTNAYVPGVPVASNSITAIKSTVLQADGDAIVTCISCHRAHGSANDDLLRWSYASMDAHASTDGNVGCFACHTTKDT